jgi:hypothetical protein
LSSSAAASASQVLVLTECIPIWNVWSDAHEWDGTAGGQYHHHHHPITTIIMIIVFIIIITTIIIIIIIVFIIFTTTIIIIIIIATCSGDGCSPTLRRLEGSIKHKSCSSPPSLPTFTRHCRHRPLGGMFDVKPYTTFATLLLPNHVAIANGGSSTCVCVGETVWLLERGIILRHERTVRFH